MDISKQKEVLTSAKEKMQKAMLHLEEELKTYRAGKANPAVFNNVMVDYFGNPTPVPQVASITTPDAKTILIQPWEKNMLGVIEKAILAANIGLTPVNNGEVIRINIPPLTEERRHQLVKQVKNEGEVAKISIRTARKWGLDELKRMLKEGLPEDTEENAAEEVQELVRDFTAKIEKVMAVKEKEVMTV